MPTISRAEEVLSNPRWIEFGQAYLNARRYSPSEADLQRIGLIAYEETRLAAEKSREAAELVPKFGPPSVEVELELGSLKNRAKYGWAGVALIGLIKYGEIRSSIDAIVHDSRWAAETANSAIVTRAQLPRDQLVKQRRTGIPGRLQRVIDAVEHGEIPPVAAAATMVNILKTADPNLPDSELRRLRSNFIPELRDIYAKKPRREQRLPQDFSITPFLHEPRFVLRVVEDPGTGRPRIEGPR